MYPDVGPLEVVRKRLVTATEQIRSRVREGALLKGQIGLLKGEEIVGKGALMTRAEEALNAITARIGTLKPSIIPTVMEKIKTFEPGKRVVEIVELPIVPTPPQQTPAQAQVPTQAPKEKKVLRG